MSDWWARRRWPAKVLLVAAGAWAAVLTLLGGAGAVLGGGDQPGSSLSTAADGYAGLAALASRYGHPVVTQRSRLDSGRLDPSSTLVVADEVLSGGETSAVAGFLQMGGRLVAVGDEGALVRTVVDPDLRWEPVGEAGVLPVSSTAPDAAGVARITLGGAGSWTALGRARAVAPAAGPPVEAVAAVGRGTVVLVADPTLWDDADLGRTDNALAALDALGPPPRPVVFSEGGRSSGSGPAALPAPWRWALGILVVSWLALLWSRGKRFGPPAAEPEETAPSRAEYVRGLAAGLGRARHPAAGVRLLREALPGQLPEGDRAAGEQELVRLARLAAGKERR